MLFYLVMFIIAEYLNLSSRVEMLSQKDMNFNKNTLIKFGYSNGMVLFLMIDSLILVFIYNIFWNLLIASLFLFMCLQAYVNFIAFPIILNNKNEELTLRISSIVGIMITLLLYLIL